MIKGINLCNLYPLPLFRFVVEEQFNVIAGRDNRYNVATIKKMLTDEEVAITDQ